MSQQLVDRKVPQALLRVLINRGSISVQVLVSQIHEEHIEELNLYGQGKYLANTGGNCDKHLFLRPLLHPSAAPVLGAET